MHRALAQLERSRLTRDGRPRLAALHDFIVSGIPHAYPAEVGSSARGVRTAHEAAGWGPSAYHDQPFAWPHEWGADDGRRIVPLHPGVPALAARAPRFHLLMALVDIARLGGRRDVTRVGRELKQMWEVKL